MKRASVVIMACLVLSILLDLLLRGSHGDFVWYSIFGFFALFGLIGCVALVLISKWLGHYWLQRPEDYYDKNDGDE